MCSFNSPSANYKEKLVKKGKAEKRQTKQIHKKKQRQNQGK
jgi:hypothetical protein